MKGRYGRVKWIATTSLVLFGATSSMADEHACRTSRHLLGRCQHIHGTVFMSADAGIMIGIDGRRWRYSVTAPTNSDWDMPRALYRPFEQSLHNEVQGDFEICPVRSTMLPTLIDGAYCISTARHLSVRKF